MAKSFTLLAEVKSQSTGETYEIRRGGDGVVYCNCKGWQFSRTTPKMCKHLAKYLAVDAGNIATAAPTFGVPKPTSKPFTPQTASSIEAQLKASLGQKSAPITKPTQPAVKPLAQRLDEMAAHVTVVSPATIAALLREAATALRAGGSQPTTATHQPVLGAVRTIWLD